MQPRDIQGLQRAIQEMHGCDSRHTDSVSVYERFQGGISWHGTVEVFELSRHEKAKQCYAWQYRDRDEIETVTVLEIPPVDSPQTAVKVAISALASAKFCHSN